jgi:hypothetical protein
LKTVSTIINIIKMALPDRSIRDVFRRNYKHINNPPLRSYLIDDSIDDSPTDDPAVNADATVDVEPAIDPALTNASALEAIDDLINPQDSDCDGNNLDAFDLVSQALSARYLRRTRTPRSWVYEFIEIQLLDNVFYTPKGTATAKPEKRY